MQKLMILFIVYGFFIAVSMVMGYAVSLIIPEYSKITTGILLISSSLIALALFIFDTGDKK